MFTVQANVIAGLIASVGAAGDVDHPAHGLHAPRVCACCLNYFTLGHELSPITIEYEWQNVSSGDFDSATAAVAGEAFCYWTYYISLGDCCCDPQGPPDISAEWSFDGPNVDAGSGSLLPATNVVAASENATCDTLTSSFSASFSLLNGDMSTYGETLTESVEYLTECDEHTGDDLNLWTGSAAQEAFLDWDLSSTAPSNATFIVTVSISAETTIQDTPCESSGRGAEPGRGTSMNPASLRGVYCRVGVQSGWGLLSVVDDGTVTPLGIFDDASFSETSGVFSGSDDFSVQVAAGNSLSFEPYTEQYSGLAGDLDRDGRLTGRDDGRFSGALGSGGGDDTYDPLGDLDQDGDIDAADESAFDSQLADFGTCVEDLYPDGTNDYSDLTLFLTYFNNGHRFADLNDDGSVDYSDVLVMLPAVSAGTCP